MSDQIPISTSESTSESVLHLNLTTLVDSFSCFNRLSSGGREYDECTKRYHNQEEAACIEIWESF